MFRYSELLLVWLATSQPVSTYGVHTILGKIQNPCTRPPNPPSLGGNSPSFC
jgi:hypothetical protein